MDKDKVSNIIRQSLKEVNDKTGMVSEENRQKTLRAFGVIKRKSSTFPRIVAKSKEPYKISTGEIKRSSLGIGSLRRDSTIFVDDYSLTLGEAEDIKLLKELDEDESLPKSALIKVANRYNFKMPLNVVLSAYEPERKFVKGLLKEENSKAIDAWIKSPDVGFYSIEYSWRKENILSRESLILIFSLRLAMIFLLSRLRMIRLTKAWLAKKIRRNFYLPESISIGSMKYRRSRNIISSFYHQEAMIYFLRHCERIRIGILNQRLRRGWKAKHGLISIYSKTITLFNESFASTVSLNASAVLAYRG